MSKNEQINFDYISNPEQKLRFDKYALITGINSPLDTAYNKNLLLKTSPYLLENSSKYLSLELYNLIKKVHKTHKNFIDYADYNTKTLRKQNNHMVYPINEDKPIILASEKKMFNPLNMSNDT
jgi:hypothetical protein